jgi:dipeptidyl aminopeptidase
MWWSPDGRRIAFLSFDEQDVPEYELPIYNPSLTAEAKSSVLPYPEKVVMRYPKVSSRANTLESIARLLRLI